MGCGLRRFSDRLYFEIFISSHTKTEWRITLPRGSLYENPSVFSFFRNSTKKTSQLHLNSTFVVYNQGVPGEGTP